MNRIYQGRVNRVETANPDKSAPVDQRWLPLADWESKLWAHHELFQDAVNYYTLALAAMAEGVEGAEGDSEKAKVVREWRGQVRGTWSKARRKAVEFSGAHHRVAMHLGLESHKTGFDDCARAVLQHSRATAAQRSAAFIRLLELAAAGEAALNRLAVEKLPFLCSKPEFFSAGDDETANAQLSRRKIEVHRIHHAAPDTLDQVANALALDFFFRTPPEGHYTGQDAAKRLRECFKHITQDRPGKPARFPELKAQAGDFERKLTQCLSAAPDALAMPQASKPPAEFHPTAVFKFLPTPETWAACKTATASVLDREVSTKSVADPLGAVRAGGQPVFDYFTNLTLIRPLGEKPSRAVWFEFDLAAFLEAIKAPHRYFQDTQKRKVAADELRGKLSALEGKGGALEDEHEEEDEAKAAGFAGDTRTDLLVELVFHTLYVGEADDDEAETKLRPFIREALARRGLQIDPHRQEYTIQERTLRGFAEIQKRWREIAAKGQATKERLLTVLADEQGKHRDDFGSASLYQSLAHPKYQSIWRDSGTEKWHAENPLKAWRAYTELRFELEDKTRAIRFTPAHAEHSPRYFIIPKGGRLGSEHQSRELAFTCGIVLRTERGWELRAAKLTYSAPRLCRDGLRTPGDTDLTAAPWLQPMMQALGLAEPDLQDFSNCRVTLQPSAPDNIQLTFPVEVAVDKLQQLLGHKERWNYQASGKAGQKNFAQFNYSASEPRSETSLRWPSDIEFAKDAKQPRKHEPEAWHQKLAQFTSLATDLGQRDAGAFALLEVRANDDFGGKPSRFTGETPGKLWRARLVASGMLRLSGEDRREWRARSKLDDRNKDDVKAGSDFREELWGERGRAALPSETEACAQLFVDFGCDEKDLLPDGWRGERDRSALSFPEQNDKLLIAARRAQSRIARLHRWCWFLSDSKQAAKIADVFAEIGKLDDDRILPAETRRLASSEKQGELLAALRLELAIWSEKLPRLLVALANRCVPLRGRSWQWDAHPAKPDCFLLSQYGDPQPNTTYRRADGTYEDVTWIRGQRGLSFERIEQIEELRKRFQSLNQTLRRTPGGPPPKRRDDTIPDPCPYLLEKLDRTKQQRVNQTAHMILAEALGVQLAPPRSDKAALRASRDLHGVYERIRPPVDFIVIEDLSRYRASQGRAPRENSRLMKWCHRAVRDKLKQLCEVFGLPVLETPAAYSSRFCSRSGVPGFRAEEVIAGFTKSGHWAWLASKKDEHGEPTAEAARLRDLDEELTAAQAELDTDWKRKNRPQPCPRRTLLVPMSGGPIFVPVVDKATGTVLAPALAQADLNAAINLALRAIADPRLWSIHPRLRTQREGDKQPGKIKKGKAAPPAITAPSEARLLTREKRKFGEAGKVLIVQRPPDAKLDDTRQPNFFADCAGLKKLTDENPELHWLAKEWTSAAIRDTDEAPTLLHSKTFWGCVKAAQWHRIRVINDQRLADWRRKQNAANPPVPGHPEL